MTGEQYGSGAVILKGLGLVESMAETMKLAIAERRAAGVFLGGRPGVKPDAAIASAASAPAEWAAPKLAILRVGGQPDDLSYENSIIKRFAGIGLSTEVFAYPENISREDFLAGLRKANEDAGIQGILVFRPLPAHIGDREVTEAIDPRKDVDGISPVNMAKVFAGDPGGFAPCTAAAVIAMLDYAGVELKGKRVTVAGRSLVVGKPLSMLLLGRDATVTVCHSKTVDLPGACREADVLVACVGKAKLLGADHIKPGATVIDVGINMDEEGRFCGDVDSDAAAAIAGAVTPVPGGVGTVTTSILAQHLLQAAGIML